VQEYDDDDDDMEGSVKSFHSSTSSADKKSYDHIRSLTHFKESLMTTERTVVQNKWQQLQYEYMDFTVKVAKQEKSEAEALIEQSLSSNREESVSQKMQQEESSYGELKTLWTYSCPLTEGENVNCMAWNRFNSQILAVGYGTLDFVSKKKGMILCWTIKNPTFPERVLRVSHSGVSCLDFSETNPSLLAAGFNDGAVAIYDIRTRSEDPIFETSKYHTGTVWDLRWVNRGKEVGERLQTVGVEGKVNSWAIKKGLEVTEIMRLKRTARGSEQIDSMVSRDFGGLCMDPYTADNNIYLVGTEEGAIYKCSCAYEQYLEAYYGHSGPVYRVRWNPLDHNTFISCSADWTVRVWHQDKFDPIVTIESFAENKDKRSSYVSDVAWSPYIATMFASVSITGKLELWDIAYSTMKPKLFTTRLSKLNCVLFARDSPTLLVGDVNGVVEVVKPVGIEMKPNCIVEDVAQPYEAEAADE